MTMITRVGFCPKCFKEARPKTGDFYITFGATSKTYKAMRALNNGRKGFVPTIYQFQRLEGKTIYYSKICCMVGCGAYLAKQDKQTFVYLNDDLCIDGYMDIDDWNALVTFKDTGLKI
jgi:hypothetical protein